MINDYRQALKAISAETNKGTRRATAAATANQEAFRNFIVEQSNVFRKECTAPREAWNKACSAWRDVQVSAQDVGPNGLDCGCGCGRGGRGIGHGQQKARPTEEKAKSRGWQHCSCGSMAGGPICGTPICRIRRLIRRAYWRLQWPRSSVWIES